MPRTRIAGVVLASVLLVSGCSTASDTAAPDATTRDGGAADAPAFDGAHVGVDDWAAAAALPGVVIVDVRTPEEFSEGHIAGAVNIDVNGPQTESPFAALDPDGEYAVYCRSGNRSRVAIDTMSNLGVENTVGLEGGITAWTDAGYAVTTD